MPASPVSPRPLDHLVLAARDLAALADGYRRLGFQVGARNRHPWGTENHVVQLDGAFLELISTARDFIASRDADPQSFSFGDFIADGLSRGDGCAMLALRTVDAAADAAAFAKAGVGAFHPFHFARQARRPDGGAVDVAFTLAFAASKLMSGAGFFACQQHFPENFWNPDFQIHPNTAKRLLAVTLIAENPSEHAEFLSHVTGQREMMATSMGLDIEIGGGRIEVLTPAAFAFRFGEPASGTPTRFAGFRVGVADLAAAERSLSEGHVSFGRHQGALIVASTANFGSALAFEAL